MGIANIINNSTTTSGGEIVRELVNSSDGQGLHFENQGNISLANSAAVEFGTSDFSLEFVLNQTGENSTTNYIYYTHEAGNSRLYVFNDIAANTFDLSFVNSSGTLTTKSLAYDMSADYGTPTHYVVTCDRDGNATLYKNGNSVATVDISDQASVDIGASNTNPGLIATAANGYGVLGTFYRFRTWNKALSSAEVQTAFERADVDFADQYGSQTELITSSSNRDFASGTGDWGANGITLVNDSGLLKVPQTAAYNPSNDLAAFSNGRTFLQKAKFSTPPNDKRYRLTLSAKATTSGSKLYFNFQSGSTTDISLNQVVTLTDSLATYSFDILPTHGTAPDYILLGLDAAEVYWIDNVSLVRTGCVSDYQTQWANPSQSLTVQDASGAADGTASASGVTQVQKVVQLNSEELRVAGSAPKIGVGLANTVTPAGKLHVHGADGEGYLRLSTDTTGATASDGTRIGYNGSDLRIQNFENSKVQFFTNNTTEALTISSTGQVGLSATPNLGSSNANNTILTLKGKAAAYGGIIEMSNHGTSGNGQTLGAISYFDPSTATTKNAEIEVLRESADDDAKMVFKTKPTGGTLADRLTIDSSGQVTVNELAGNTTNSTKLEVRSDADGSTSAIRTTNKDQTAGTNQAAGVDFGLSRNSGAFKPQAGQIIVGRVSDWDASDTNIDSYMAFSTYGNNSLGERMRIHSSGGTAGFITVGPIHGGIIFDNTSGTSGATRIQQSYSGSTPELRLGSNVGTTVSSAMNIISGDAGLVKFNGGIAFSQTNSSATGATATGTTLNHYEEGTWTPVPKDNQATVVATSTALGRYVRVGKIVTCTYRLVRNDTQSLTNSLYLYGLPFPSQNNVQTKNIGGGTSWFPNDTYAGFNYALENTDQWIIRKNDATGYATTNVWSNGQELIGTIIYEADA